MSLFDINQDTKSTGMALIWFNTYSKFLTVRANFQIFGKKNPLKYIFQPNLARNVYKT